MVLKNNFLLLLFLIVIFSNKIFSAGLVVTDLSYNSEKTQGVDSNYNLVLTNTNSFNMYNITIDSNEYIYFPKIEVLNGGSSINITGTITSNESFSKNFTIKGFYYTDIGISNNTYNVNINYPAGSDNCNIVATIGDKIIFYNNVLDNVVIRNFDTGNDITTISMNSSYIMTLNYAGSLNYYFLRSGYGFGNKCTITTLNTQGYVNNPNYDAIVSFEVSVNYQPTILEYTFINTNYTINAYSYDEGVIYLRNIGNFAAHNVTLSGDWFTFSKNNFEIPVNEGTVVNYKIYTNVEKTNETNKTYIQKVTINGNFNYIEQNFEIFVPYLDLDNKENITNYKSLISAIDSICKAYPDLTFCNDNPQVIYVGNKSNDDFSINLSKEQVAGIFAAVLEAKDSNLINNNLIKEQLNSIQTNLSELNNATLIIQEIKSKEEQSSKAIKIAATLILMSTIFTGALIFMLYKKREERLKNASRW